MNNFEKQYYESPAFWEGEMLQDTTNMERFAVTANMIPTDVTSLLDAGCGNGVFINYLARHKPFLKLHGLDRSRKALEFVKSERTQGDVSSLPFTDESFDCISCLEVLEHLPIESYENTLRELTRVSKKYLIISVPYNEDLEESYTKCPSCTSIFNYELHLRKFADGYFENMLELYGFENVKAIKAGQSVRYMHHNLFRKIFYPEQFRKWNSPICPLCGYQEAITQKRQSGTVTIKDKRKLVSFFTSLPKLFWPTETRHYWIIGVFQKK